jgi:hypothetical protein
MVGYGSYEYSNSGKKYLYSFEIRGYIISESGISQETESRSG